MKPGITVAIPAHPPRVTNGLLQRALASVWAQTLPAGAVSVVVDHNRDGAAITRQHALDAVNTEWVAFLDSDDQMFPQHLERLHAHALATGSDYVYSWFQVVGGADPFPQHFGQPFNPADPIQTTITTLVRTELAQSVGFLRPTEGDLIGGNVWGEDYQWTLGCARAGAKITHLPERTWAWHHDSSNTSGRPDRW